MAEVELAMAYIDAERHDEAARLLDDLDHVEHRRALGPRIYDAIDRAWTELHLSTGDTVKAGRRADRMRVGFWRDATLAKLRLADGDSDQAARILDSLSPTSPRQHVTLGLLQALASATHDPAFSLAEAAGALKIAATEGMVQTVIAAGPGVAALLEVGSWAAPDEWTEELRLILAKAPAGSTTGRVPTLYEQPSQRERAVARYLASRLTVAEIAREMGVSTNTLKTHVSALYRKLEVNSRKEFVAKARRLGVIG
jgi:LuxR family maltose regulon positive regulatory protein